MSNQRNAATTKCPTCGHGAKTTKRVYIVRWTTMIDRPELRGPTYGIVAAGTRLQSTNEFSTAKAAKNYVASLLRGEYDFGSEFISSVNAYSVMMTVDFDEYRYMKKTEIGRRSKLGKSYTRKRTSVTSDQVELAEEFTN